MHDGAAYEPARRLLTRTETADRLAVSLRVVDRLIGEGELRCMRIGRSVRVDPRDLAAFIGRQRGAAVNDHDPEVSRVAEEAGGHVTRRKA